MISNFLNIFFFSYIYNVYINIYKTLFIKRVLWKISLDKSLKYHLNFLSFFYLNEIFYVNSVDIKLRK
jgi:hypothetical protein